MKRRIIIETLNQSNCVQLGICFARTLMRMTIMAKITNIIDSRIHFNKIILFKIILILVFNKCSAIVKCL